eukprot:gene59295-79123_t
MNVSYEIVDDHDDDCVCYKNLSESNTKQQQQQIIDSTPEKESYSHDENRKDKSGHKAYDDYSTKFSVPEQECVMCLGPFDETDPMMPTLCLCGENKALFHYPCLL